MRISLPFVGVACLFALTGSVAAQNQAPPLAITHVNVVDVRAGRVVPNRTVVIESGRITSVGAADSVQPPRGAHIIDGNAKYLIPGLWDMHVHAAWEGIDEVFAPLFTANGITGVREMWGQLPRIRQWKNKYASGAGWPRIVGSGHILDGPQPIWQGSVKARNPEQARHAVDSLHAAGADFIKVYSRLPRAAYLAAAEEAKRVGTYIAGHVPGAVTVSEASDAGQRTIEHMTSIALDCSSVRDSVRTAQAAVTDTSVATVMRNSARQITRILATHDPARCSELSARLARNHTWQVPTLVVLRSMASLDDDRFTADPRVKYLPKGIVSGWNWRNDFRLRARTPEDWNNARAMLQRNREIVSAMHRAGVPMLAGTDVLNPYAFPGFSLHDELVLLVDAGLSPADALRTATWNPAVFLSATDSLGTVEKGKRADLDLLDANPLTDIHNTHKLNAVVLNGRYYNRAALDQLLADAEKKAK